ncbi:MAG: hypothetical protein Q4A42_06615 [Tissierellia bacterium]|nr:hypothetical protein [Tissierellia bacterium]
MSKIKIVLLFIANIIIDLVLLSRYSIYGATLAISIPMIIILSMNSKTDSITYYAILIGLFKEVSFFPTIGIYALSYYLISYYSFKRSRLGGMSYKLGLLILIISVFLNYIFTNTLRMISMGYFETARLIDYLLGPIFTEMLVGFIFYTVIYVLFFRINAKKKKRYFL